MTEYVTVNFRTPSGFKQIKIKKPPAVPVGIKSGALGGSEQGSETPIFIGRISIQEQMEATQRQPIEVATQGGGGGGNSGFNPEGKHIKVDGIPIPDIASMAVKLESATEENVKTFDTKYSLIPKNPAPGQPVLAYAHIIYNQKTNEPVYAVVEPKIDEKDTKRLDEIKEYIQEKIDINFAQLTKSEAIKYITTLVDRAFDYFRIKDASVRRDVYKYYILRDFIGLGKIEPIMQDKQIEDISCDGINIPLYVYHRNPKLGSIRTNISFSSQEELDYFVNKLAERCGKTISVAHPLLDGSLPDGSRVQATLGSDIARRGSNYTIRMFTEKPLTPVDLLLGGTCDLKMMAYFWMLVENGMSVLISGGTASGKTTFLNVLSLFIRPQLKIVSIEDTAELRIPHAHWVPEVARTPIAEEGRVDLFQLLKESLRQRPDYIIVGEVRGQEAYVLFQQMATGHPGISTIHADNFAKLMDRLTSPPISLPPSLIQNLDAIMFVKRIKQGRRYARKIYQTVEVLGYDSQSNTPIVNDVFQWDAGTDLFQAVGTSGLLKKIATFTGVSAEALQEELERRARVLEWLVKQNITDYRKVAAVINLFYTSPDFLLERIGRV